MGQSERVILRVLQRSPYSHLKDIISTIPFLSIKARKDILVVCRVQSDIDTNPRLRTALQYSLTHLPYLHPLNHDKWIYPDVIIRAISSEVRGHPILAGFFSMLTRSLPFRHKVDPKTERDASVQKEFNATQSLDREQVLNYSAWFGSDNDSLFTPLSQHLPPRPELNERIRACFVQWRENLANSVLIPQFQQNRSMGRETARRLLRDMGFDEQYAEKNALHMSTRDLEVWYMRTGRWIEGPCEMRFVWKFNDLKGRTYFTAGGTTQKQAKYVRRIWNSLANQFSMTHFLTRMTVTRIRVPFSCRMVIYDYASFTSQMAEQKYFIEELAEFCRGTVVRLLDTNRGLINVDLGDFLDEYNTSCNRHAEFSMERLWDGDYEYFEHKLAGFLGNYGNITSCTVLHGLHACQISGDLDNCTCVGDDAFVSVEREEQSMKEAMAAVNSLGKVPDEKFEVWEKGEIIDEETGWTFIKRPIDRFQERVVVGSIIDLPIIGLIFPDLDDDAHTVSPGTLWDRISIMASQSMTVFNRCRINLVDMGEDELELAFIYLESCYRELGMPLRGALPGDFIPVIECRGMTIPPVHEDCFRRDWMEVLIESRRGEISTLPRTMLEDDVDEIRRDLIPGEIIEYAVTRGVSLLRKLELLDTSLIIDEYEVDDVYLRILSDLFSGVRVCIYSIEVFGCPFWYKDLSYEL